MSVPIEVHSTLSSTYRTLCISLISVHQPITEVKAEWNVAADVWDIRYDAFMYLGWTDGRTDRFVNVR